MGPDHRGEGILLVITDHCQIHNIGQQDLETEIVHKWEIPAGMRTLGRNQNRVDNDVS